jgi:hypothetical protein
MELIRPEGGRPQHYHVLWDGSGTKNIKEITLQVGCDAIEDPALHSSQECETNYNSA